MASLEVLTRVVSVVSAIGIPSIFAITVWCTKQCVRYTNQLTILMKAQKAQMRAQLLKDYAFYEKQGWISIIELTEWQNQYNAYHQLVGDNGVLDNRYEKLKDMPNAPTV